MAGAKGVTPTAVNVVNTYTGTIAMPIVSKFLFPEASEKLDKLTEQISEVANLMSGVLKEIPAGIGEQTLNLVSEMRNVTSALNKFITGEDKSWVDKLMEVLMFVYDIIIALVSKSWASAPTLAIRLASILGMSPVRVVEWFGTLFSGAPKDEIEGLENVEEPLWEGQGLAADFSLSTMLVGLVGAIATRKLPDSKTISNISTVCRIADCLPRVATNVADLAVKLVSVMPQCVQEWVYWAFPEEWFLDRNQKTEKFFEWAGRVRSYDTRSIRDRLTWDPALQKAILEDHNLGVRFLAITAVSDCVNSKTYQFLNRSFTVINELKDEVENARTGQGFRIPPYSVALCGKPGLGKSYLASLIPPLLAPEGVPKEHLIYARSPGTKHWDEYRGQYSVFFDDFGQSLLADCPEVFELIQAISPLKMVVPMADVSEKGRCFVSKLVVATTNSPYADFSMFIRENLAAWRRRQVLARVSVRKSYLDPITGTVDPRKIKRDGSNDHYIIELLNPTCPVEGDNLMRDRRGRPLVFTYKGFMKYLIRDYHNYMELAKISEENRDLSVEEFRREFEMERGAPILPWEEQPDPGYMGLLHELHAIENDLAPPEDLEHVIIDAVQANANLRENVMADDWEGQIDPEEEFVDADGGIMTYEDYARSVANLCDRTQALADQGAEFRLLCEQLRLKRQRENWFFSIFTTQRVLVGMCLGIVGVVCYYLYKNRDSNVAEQSGDQVTRRMPVVQMLAEGSSDPGGMDIARCAIAPYTFILESDHGSLNAIAVKGKVLMTTAHFFLRKDGTELQDGEPIRIRGPVEFETTYDKTRAIRLGNKDVVLYNFGPRFRSVRDNLSHFVRNEDLCHLVGSQATLIPFDKHLGTIVYKHIHKLCGLPKPTSYTIGETKINYQLTSGFAYNIDTMRGDCGAAVVALNVKAPRKVLGIHVAGSKTLPWGMCEIVTQQMLEQALALMEPQVVGTPMVSQMGPLTKARIIPDGNFSLNGVLPPSLTPRLPEKTDIRKSEIYEEIWPHTTEPAALTPKDPRIKNGTSPLANGIKKYGIPSKPVDPVILKRAVQGVKEVIASFEVKGPRRVLTDDEAINGLPFDYFDALQMDTSPGWPYCLRKPPNTKGKRFLFRTEEVPERRYYLQDMELIEKLNAREEALCLGKRVPSIWVDMIKDERRKIKKIEEAKTRCFVIPPVDYTIAFRKYVLAFAAHFYGMHSQSFSSVGMDPFSYDWTRMMTRLLAKGKKGFAGDYVQFDGRIPPEFIDAVCEIVNDWYNDGPENALKRRVLFDELCHTMQLSMGTVYTSHQGNPSGCPITSIFNSIVNALYLRVAYLSMAPPEESSIKSYNENVAETTYGDDFIAVPTEKVGSWFNMHTYVAFWKNYGIDITAPDKETEMEPLTDVLDLAFLKCTTRKVGNLYVALMDKNTITEMTNWIRESPDDHLATEDNANQALRFSFFWGKEYFEENRRLLLNASKRIGKVLDLYDYEHFKKQTEIEPTLDTNMTMRRTNIGMLFDLEDLLGLSERIPQDVRRDVTGFFREEHRAAQEEYRKETGILRPGSDNRPLFEASPVRSEGLERQINKAMKTNNQNYLATFDKFAQCQQLYLETELGDEFARRWMEPVQIHREKFMEQCRKHFLDLGDESFPFVDEVQAESVMDWESQAAPVSGAVGVTFVDGDVREGSGTAHTSRGHLEIGPVNDTHWDLAQMVERWSLVDTLQWTNTATGFVVARYNLPVDMIKSLPVTRAFNAFQFWRGGIKVRFMVNGTKFHIGRLIAYWTPLRNPVEVLAWQEQSFAAATGLNHVFVDAMVSNTGELEIPYVHPKQYLHTNDIALSDSAHGAQGYLGTLTLQVFNPLLFAAGASNSLAVSVYVSFNDAEFKLLRNEANIFPFDRLFVDKQMRFYRQLVRDGHDEDSQKMADLRLFLDRFDRYLEEEQVPRKKPRLVAQPSKQVVASLNPLKRRREKDHPRIKQQALNSEDVVEISNGNAQFAAEFSDIVDFEAQMEILDGAAEKLLSDGVGALSKIAKKAIPKHLATDAFNALSALDAPNIPLEPQVLVRRAIGPLANCQTVSNVNRLTLYPGEQAEVGPEEFGTSVDEMGWDFLIRTPIFYGTTQWTSTQIENVILGSGFLGPLDVFSRFSAVAEGTLIPMTNLDYYATMFEFWSGSLIFKFSIVTSQFSTGRLVFGVGLGDRTLPLSRTEISAQYQQVIDVADTREFTIEVPFTARTDMLRCSAGAPVYGPVVDPQGTQNQDVLNSFTGTWGLGIVNRLVVPSNIPGTAYINLFFCGGKDFKFSTPRDGCRALLPVFNPVPALEDMDLDDMEAQSDAIEEVKTTHEDGTYTVITTAGNSTRPQFPGDIVMSPRDLIKRYSPAISDTLEISNSQAVLFGYNDRLFSNTANLAVRPISTPYITPATPRLIFNNSGALARMGITYAAWKGPIRWKIVVFPACQAANSQAALGYTSMAVAHEPTMKSFANGVFELDALPGQLTGAITQINYLFSPFSRFSEPTSGSIVAMAQSEANTPYVEFETHHLNNNAVCLTSFTKVDFNLNEMEHCGQLFTVIKNQLPVSGLTDTSFAYSVFQAGGDSFRYGCFLGIPLMAATKYYPIPSLLPPILPRENWFLDYSNYVGFDEEFPTDFPDDFEDQMFRNEDYRGYRADVPIEVGLDAVKSLDLSHSFFEDCEKKNRLIVQGWSQGKPSVSIVNEMRQQFPDFKYVEEDRVVGKPPNQVFQFHVEMQNDKIPDIFEDGIGSTKKKAREETAVQALTQLHNVLEKILVYVQNFKKAVSKEFNEKNGNKTQEEWARIAADKNAFGEGVTQRQYDTLVTAKESQEPVLVVLETKELPAKLPERAVCVVKPFVREEDRRRMLEIIDRHYEEASIEFGVHVVDDFGQNTTAEANTSEDVWAGDMQNYDRVVDASMGAAVYEFIERREFSQAGIEYSMRIEEDLEEYYLELSQMHASAPLEVDIVNFRSLIGMQETSGVLVKLRSGALVFKSEGLCQFVPLFNVEGQVNSVINEALSRLVWARAQRLASAEFGEIVD